MSRFLDPIDTVKRTNPIFSTIFYSWEQQIMCSTKQPVFLFFLFIAPLSRAPNPCLFRILSIFFPFVFSSNFRQNVFFSNVSIELPEDFSVTSWFLPELRLIPITLWECLSLNHGLKHASKKIWNESQTNFCGAKNFSCNNQCNQVEWFGQSSEPITQISTYNIVSDRN